MDRRDPGGEVETLEIDNEAGNVEVVIEERDDVLVTSRRTSAFWDRAVSEVGADSGTLSVRSECSTRIFLVACEVEHVIRLPAGAVGSLSIVTTAGQVDVDGFAGELEVRTTAGTIEIVVPDETYWVDAAAEVGTVDADVRHDEDADRVIRARTTAGTISIDRR